MKSSRTVLFIRRTVLVSLLSLLAWLPALPALAVDQPSGEVIPSAPPLERGVMAAGSVEDTLKACLARIPQDASVGQRMMAEQSCDRDEMDRKSFQAVPGR